MQTGGTCKPGGVPSTPTPGSPTGTSSVTYTNTEGASKSLHSIEITNLVNHKLVHFRLDISHNDGSLSTHQVNHQGAEVPESALKLACFEGEECSLEVAFDNQRQYVLDVENIPAGMATSLNNGVLKAIGKCSSVAVQPLWRLDAQAYSYIDDVIASHNINIEFNCVKHEYFQRESRIYVPRQVDSHLYCTSGTSCSTDAHCAMLEQNLPNPQVQVSRDCTVSRLGDNVLPVYRTIQLYNTASGLLMQKKSVVFVFLVDSVVPPAPSGTSSISAIAPDDSSLHMAGVTVNVSIEDCTSDSTHATTLECKEATAKKWRACAESVSLCGSAVLHADGLFFDTEMMFRLRIDAASVQYSAMVQHETHSFLNVLDNRTGVVQIGASATAELCAVIYSSAHDATAESILQAIQNKTGLQYLSVEGPDYTSVGEQIYTFHFRDPSVAAVDAEKHREVLANIISNSLFSILHVSILYGYMFTLSGTITLNNTYKHVYAYLLEQVQMHLGMHAAGVFVSKLSQTTENNYEYTVEVSAPYNMQALHSLAKAADWEVSAVQRHAGSKTATQKILFCDNDIDIDANLHVIGDGVVDFYCENGQPSRSNQGTNNIVSGSSLTGTQDANWMHDNILLQASANVVNFTTTFNASTSTLQITQSTHSASGRFTVISNSSVVSIKDNSNSELVRLETNTALLCQAYEMEVQLGDNVAPQTTASVSVSKTCKSASCGCDHDTANTITVLLPSNTKSYKVDHFPCPICPPELMFALSTSKCSQISNGFKCSIRDVKYSTTRIVGSSKELPYSVSL